MTANFYTIKKQLKDKNALNIKIQSIGKVKEAQLKKVTNPI